MSTPDERAEARGVRTGLEGIEKLPEWPDAASVDFQDTHDSNWYFMKESDAALARMEALVAEVIDLRDMADDRLGGADFKRIEALLAACARKEAGR